ncbi:hypothetical protein N7532_003779 [Penicillium argentinense]|uniref:WD repeat protein n=1 Tax=Penicillium argentinense TaxID=1131581 RepID=A0A9W9FNL4_9EURO|nr:uncharacterized protein N7532_003779 [Penicillium argentinense]KAJ5103250.1 hypothetical protein N7532_003779 [Penicillium argentinense]
MTEIVGLSPFFEHVDACLPITALKTFEWGQRLFVFQGQGPFSRIVDDQTGNVVAQIQAFKRNNVHGFIPLPYQQKDGHARVIIWGGQSIRAADLVFGPDDSISLSPISSEFLAPDWILSGCAAVGDGLASAYLITANNALLSLKLVQSEPSQHQFSICIHQLTTSVKSILYSADLVALSASHLLIASGTAFGETIVWSCFINESKSPNPEAIGSIHHFFTGHDGSIYGVRISPKIQTINGGKSGRLLASCSDDRTVRIWDISDCDSKSAEDHSAYSTDGFELRSTGFGSTATEHSGLGSESCIAKSFGHAARIWGIKFRSMREDYPNNLGIVTRGEDCNCVEWDLNWETSATGETQYQLRQTASIHRHSGKHIWSMDLCSRGVETVVFTGGADGALKSFKIREDGSLKPPEPPVNLKKEKLRGPKNFALVAPDCLLAFSMSNELQLGHLSPGENVTTAWETLCVIEDLSSFIAMAGIHKLGLVLLGNSKGLIRLYNHGTRSLCELVTLGERALGLFPLESTLQPDSFSFIASYLSDEKATLVTVNDWNTSSPQVEATTFALPGKPYDIASAGVTHDQKYLLIGSKLGGLAVYRNSGLGLSSEPVVLDRHAHGGEGTNYIQALPQAKEHQSGDSHYILTCGRDDTYCVREIKTSKDGNDVLSFETIHQTSSGLGNNLSGAYHDEVSGDLMLYGFKGQTFVLRNESQQNDIASFVSGGARRAWAFHPGVNGSDDALFVYKEGSKLQTIRIQKSRNRSLRLGCHGREIKSMDCRAAVPGQPLLFATAAEDATLRIMSPSDNAMQGPWGSFQTHHILKAHDSGIQHVSWSKDGQYLFSSAADEEFFVWKIGSVPPFGVTVMLLAKAPTPDVKSEVRITNFDMVEVEESGSGKGFLLCLTMSNSKIKIFHFSPKSRQFTQLAKGQYMTNCLTEAHFVVKESSISLVTAATDGYFTLWDLTSTLDPFYTVHSSTTKLKSALDSSSISPENITCESRYQVNSNSIKAMELLRLSDTVVMVLTGSDDNSISLSLLKTSSTSTSRNAQVATVSIPDAHTASVTTLKVIDQQTIRDAESDSIITKLTVASSGNDHRAKIWSITIDPARDTDGIKIDLLVDRYSSVADISSIGLIQEPESDQAKLLICGVGLELLQLRSQ